MPVKEKMTRTKLEPPDQAEIIALIAELDAYQDTLYPQECRYSLDIGAMTQANVLFAVARTAGGVAIGCGAIVLGTSYGEVKRMYVRPEARGDGAAQSILCVLEHAAHAKGCRSLMLETGPYQPAALAFYGKQGFVRCGAFGDYPEHPFSVFMRKELALEGVAQDVSEA